MSDAPEDLRYVDTHEWVKVGDDGIAIVGITDFAQSELGDIVFVELPEVGSQVHAKDEVSVVESVKTASDIYAPVSGEIVAVNELLDEEPETINALPYDSGWMFKILMSDEAELDDLLGAKQYTESCEDD